MRRREFIALLSGATAWPLAARAQQRERMRSVGVLTPFSPHDSEGQNRVTAFVQALQQVGWSVGQNIRLHYRWGDGTSATMQKYAVELVALAPDVILADSSAALAPLLQATQTIPIVFAIVADPVGAGYVESLARPGGNATGFTPFEYAHAATGHAAAPPSPAMNSRRLIRSPRRRGPATTTASRGRVSWRSAS